MVVVIFDTASPALGTDIFAANAVMDRYSKGRSSRKVMAMAILGGTVGTGKFSLRYGADVIAEGLQATTNDSTFTTVDDYQAINDGRWCSPEQQVSLIVDEAPAATLKLIVWMLEAQK